MGLVEPRSTAQTQLGLAFPAFGHSDPRIHAAHLLATVLGRGISSRLFLSVREHLGLAYSVSAGFTDLGVTGAMTVRGGLRTDKLSEAIKAIVWELGQLKADPIDDEELARAKALEKARLLFGLERVEVVADYFGGHELLFGARPSLEEEIAQIDKVGADDIQALAGALFAFDQLKVAAIGNLDQDTLSRFLDQSLGQASGRPTAI